MFGYIKTDIPNMYVKDTVLYKAMYCGLCKGIGKVCGQKGRFVLNYDLTFLSVLVHNLAGVDIDIEKQRCVIHQVKKRPIAKTDALTERIAALNVILAHHKLNDDVIDSGKGKCRRAFFSSSYKKAKRKEPVLDKIVAKNYAELVKYEKTNGDSIDRSADPFSVMMREIVSELLQDNFNQEIGELAYNLGKWIYLIDALDDFDKDKKNKNFNVFVNAYADVCDKQSLIKEKGTEIIYIFGNILNDIARDSNDIKYKFNHDLIDNILLRGLPIRTREVMENKKCKNTIKF